MSKKRILLAAPTYPTGSHYMSSLFNKKAEHQLTIKDEYDRLFNVVLRNTV